LADRLAALTSMLKLKKIQNAAPIAICVAFWIAKFQISRFYSKI